jgi:hypothetical protein
MCGWCSCFTAFRRPLAADGATTAIGRQPAAGACSPPAPRSGPTPSACQWCAGAVAINRGQVTLHLTGSICWTEPRCWTSNPIYPMPIAFRLRRAVSRPNYRFQLDNGGVQPSGGGGLCSLVVGRSTRTDHPILRRTRARPTNGPIPTPVATA